MVRGCAREAVLDRCVSLAHLLCAQYHINICFEFVHSAANCSDRLSRALSEDASLCSNMKCLCTSGRLTCALLSRAKSRQCSGEAPKLRWPALGGCAKLGRASLTPPQCLGAYWPVLPMLLCARLALAH
eukprot:2382461-Amphidinium_carterae.1